MNAEIIAIGSELVSGDVQESNAAFLAKRLLPLGIKVNMVTVVGDEEWVIENALEKALKDVDIKLVLVTGGLGSTTDDITSKVAAKVTGRRLMIADEVMEHIRSILAAKGKEMHPAYERQALIPQRGRILKNPAGTSCGYLIHHQGKVLVFLPGVPQEMKRMTDDVLIPLLEEEGVGGKPAPAKSFHIFGLTESRIEELVSSGLQKTGGLKLSYLPRPREVALKITAEAGADAQKMEEAAALVRSAIGDFIFAEDEGTMEETIGNLLRVKKKSLAVAESCTGGLIGSRITDVPGSSDYFRMGVVAYANEAKAKILDVEPFTIETHGAVSAQTAVAMAQGVRKLGNASFGLAVTGIAGPAGGTDEKPVGTVYIALSSESGTRFKGFKFHGDREEIKNVSAQAALEFLRRALLSV